MERVEVKIRLFKGGKMPARKSAAAACFDAYARLSEPVVIQKGMREKIPLGFAYEVPEGYEVQVRPRSGLTFSSIDNGFGTGDEDYRGELCACVINNSIVPFTVNNGDRVCQIAIRPVPYVELVEVSELSETERGEKGFGSTGLR